MVDSKICIKIVELFFSNLIISFNKYFEILTTWTNVRLVPNIALDRPYFGSCPIAVAPTEIPAMEIHAQFPNDHSPTGYFVGFAKSVPILYPSRPMDQRATHRAPIEYSELIYDGYPLIYRSLLQQQINWNWFVNNLLKRKMWKIFNSPTGNSWTSNITSSLVSITKSRTWRMILSSGCCLEIPCCTQNCVSAPL